MEEYNAGVSGRRAPSVLLGGETSISFQLNRPNGHQSIYSSDFMVDGVQPSPIRESEALHSVCFS